MRRFRPVASEKSDKASFLKPARASTDGKDAKLGYADDSTHQTIDTPYGESGGDHALRTSKWQGNGQKARH